MSCFNWHVLTRDEQALYDGVQAIDWSAHLGVDNTLAVDFTGVRSRIAHSRFAQQRIKDAVVDQLRDASGVRPSVDTDLPDVRINVHMMEASVTVAIDLSGESLHQRGYRREGRSAPLKENIAAAMLLRGDWPALAAEGGALIDPMCGSGTLLIEAAWMATDTAPGLLRTRFGFHHWRGHDDTLWKPLIDEALERQERGSQKPPTILGFDHDDGAVTASRDLKRRAIERLKQVLFAHHPHFFAMAVVGECLDDIAARMTKIAMNLCEHFGVLKCDLRNEFASSDIAATLGLEQVTLGTNYRALTETLKQIISHY